MRLRTKTMPLPLRLTPFEEYMLLDDQAAYPMSCFFLVKLQGQFNVSILGLALQNVLPSHPLLTSSVIEKKGRFYWQNRGTPPKINRLPLDKNRRFPASRGIDLFNEPSLKITICSENYLPETVRLDGETNIIFEIHHSASDAAGTVRFIEDVLCNYAQQVGTASFQREPVNLDLLSRRGTFGPPRHNILQALPKQLWGLLRAWKFLVHRVVPLSFKKPLQTPKPSENYPAILCRDLTSDQTQSVRQRAKELGITVNDLLLGAAFLAMHHWREKYVAEKKSGNLRIAVPTNLRTSADVNMPAANIVSMVFLDRKPKNIQNNAALYQEIHREMLHIKQCDLGWAFIHGVTLFQQIFGSVRRMVKQDRCWSSATVSNLGRVFIDMPLPVREGSVQITDTLKMVGVESAPPIRSWTALGICAMTFAGKMTINLHYDTSVLSSAHADSILKSVFDECVKL